LSKIGFFFGQHLAGGSVNDIKVKGSPPIKGQIPVKYAPVK